MTSESLTHCLVSLTVALTHVHAHRYADAAKEAGHALAHVRRNYDTRTVLHASPWLVTSSLVEALVIVRDAMREARNAEPALGGDFDHYASEAIACARVLAEQEARAA